MPMMMGHPPIPIGWTRAAVPLLCLGLTILSACAPLTGEGQPQQTGLISLGPGQSVGQTFTAEYRGLNGLEVFLAPGTSPSGSLRLTLREAPGSEQRFAQAWISLGEVEQPGFYRLSFDPQLDSSRRDYYLSFETQDGGAVNLGTATGAAYIDGALYLDGSPVDSQLSFRPLHDSRALAAGLAGEALTWGAWLVVAAFLLVVPGWALLHLLLPRVSELAWFERAALAGGIGVALYPLLFVFADLVDAHVGRWMVWVVPALSFIYIAWRTWLARGAQAKGLGSNQAETTSLQTHARAAGIALAGMVVLIAITRFFAIRTIDVPMWGDSVQHAVMAQRLFEMGGLFDSWLPYTPYATLTVQFGFPTIAALFMWAPGLTSPQAVLVAAQVLSLMAVVGIYPLATRLARGNRWAGVIAVLVAGLLSPMPAYYLNWGRYAQLAGLASLPAALWLMWNTLAAEDARLRRALITALMIAGMALAYYRMVFFIATFAVALVLVWVPSAYGKNARRWAKGLLALGLAALLSALLFLPWAVNVAGSPLAAAMEGGVAKGGSVAGVLAELAAWKELPGYVPWALLVIAALALAWAAARKAWSVVALGGWTVLLALYVAGRLIHLPGANMMQSFAVMISLFIPVGVLCGWLGGDVAGWFELRVRRIGSIVVTSACLALGLWGAWQMRGIARADFHAMVTRPDLRAMAWIRENTPLEARFLVEGFRIYDGRSAVGSDAGWWIPLLAGRANTMPPQYALLNERPIDADYTRKVVELVAGLEANSPASPEGMRLLCEQGITHVYIGQRQGTVGFAAPQLFAPDDFAPQPAFDLVYREDRVYVFAFDRATCPAQ